MRNKFISQTFNNELQTQIIANEELQSKNLILFNMMTSGLNTFLESSDKTVPYTIANLFCDIFESVNALKFKHTECSRIFSANGLFNKRP